MYRALCAKVVSATSSEDFLVMNIVLLIAMHIVLVGIRQAVIRALT